MKKILVFGLGSMGYGIAQTLHRSGYTVYGQDKNPVQQQRFVEGGGFDTCLFYPANTGDDRISG